MLVQLGLVGLYIQHGRLRVPPKCGRSDECAARREMGAQISLNAPFIGLQTEVRSGPHGSGTLALCCDENDDQQDDRDGVENNPRVHRALPEA